MTTGKNKEQFVSWYVNNNWHLKSDDDYVGVFDFLEKLPFEMKIGVYLSYYDSFGFVILIDYHNLSGQFSYAIDRKGYDVWFNSRNEAYKEAFKQANESINKQLNNK